MALLWWGPYGTHLKYGMNIYLPSLTDRGEAVPDTYTCIVVSVGRHSRHLHHANTRHIALLPVLGDTVGTYTIQADQTDVVQKLLIKDSSISTFFYLARKLQLFSIQSNYSRKFSFSGVLFCFWFCARNWTHDFRHPRHTALSSDENLSPFPFVSSWNKVFLWCECSPSKYLFFFILGSHGLP